MNAIPWDSRHPDAVFHSTLRGLFESQLGFRRKTVIRSQSVVQIGIGKAAETMGVSDEGTREIMTESGA
jgi:hypothetical protein